MRCRQKKGIGKEPIGEAGFKEKGKYETGTKKVYRKCAWVKSYH